MNLLQTIRRTTLALAAAATLTVGAAGAALAENSATQEVTAAVGGQFAASIEDITFDDLEFSLDNQTNEGTMRLNVVDARGLGSGWNVTVVASNFTVGTSSIVIPASGFVIEEAGAPVRDSGQPIKTDGPRIPTANSSGALSGSRKPLEASPHTGNGAYHQFLDVSLEVPGGTEAGVYVATMTVTISPGL
jgi:hypothetical protein